MRKVAVIQKGNLMHKACSNSIARLLSPVILASLLIQHQATAEVKLPKVFGNHMVLQQAQPLTIWGWANPGEKITVQLLSETKTATANEKGEWKVVLSALKVGGPVTMTVKAANTITLKDILVGEVWLCSGQSNMEMGIGAIKDGQQEIAEQCQGDAY